MRRTFVTAAESLDISAYAVKRLGASVRTLKEWEQGRRKPSGAAKKLIEIAERHPNAFKEIAM